jgi:hypothetical protein
MLRLAKSDFSRTTLRMVRELTTLAPRTEWEAAGNYGSKNVCSRATPSTPNLRVRERALGPYHSGSCAGLEAGSFNRHLLMPITSQVVVEDSQRPRESPPRTTNVMKPDQTGRKRLLLNPVKRPPQTLRPIQPPNLPSQPGINQKRSSSETSHSETLDPSCPVARERATSKPRRDVTHREFGPNPGPWLRPQDAASAPPVRNEVIPCADPLGSSSLRAKFARRRPK